MNVRESMTHEQAVELLPWLVNDSLGGDEKDSVQRHAHACVICRRELDELRGLRESVLRTATRVPDPDMRNINARIDALIDRKRWPQRLKARTIAIIASPWRLAFLVQSVLLLVLASLVLWPGSRQDEFRTLTSVTDLPDGNYIRVVFSPELGDPEIAEILGRFELEIVHGPTARGVYTLGPGHSKSHRQRNDLAVSLRGESGVLFAQPVPRGMDQ